MLITDTPMRWRFAVCPHILAHMFSFWLIELAPNCFGRRDPVTGNRTLFPEPSYLSDFHRLFARYLRRRLWVRQMGVCRTGVVQRIDRFFGRASSSQFQSQVTVRWNRVTIDKGRQRVLMIRGTCYNNGSNSRTTFLAVWANSDT